jgi:uncharacterized protein YkwD
LTGTINKHQSTLRGVVEEVSVRRWSLVFLLVPFVFLFTLSCGGGGGGGEDGGSPNNNRSEVAAFFHSDYATAFSTTSGWDGDTSSCSPGDITLAFADDVIQAVNFFRAMAGLPGDVTLDNTLISDSQDLALMMEANSRIAHDWGSGGICEESGAWNCYTQEGCEAAKKSNLYYHSGQVVAGEFIARSIEDTGNEATLGHRRWILYPPQEVMGLGSAESYAALWIMGPWGTRPSLPEWIAWPPSGYVPYQVTYDVWSFSAASPASFAGATVSVTKDGGNVPVTATVLPLLYGDPAISWEFDSPPTFSPGMSDMAYTVTIGNISGMAETSYTYGVTVFDPESP